MITLRQLKYLESLSRHLHFGKAANECAISQPALSVQIKELEARLGVMLFERGQNGVIVTAEGTEILRRARNILEQVADLGDYAKGNIGMAGPLRIGVIATIAPYILPQLLPLLKENYPQMEPLIRESRTAQLTEELANGNLDLIILALPVADDSFISMELFDDPFVLALPRDSTPPKDNLELAQFIKNEHLLLLEEGHCLRDQALQHCDIAGVQYGKIYGTSNLTTLVQMVSGGLGITILPKMCLPLEIRDDLVKLVNFEKPVPFRIIGICWRKSSPNSRHYRDIGGLLKSIHYNWN